MRIRLLVHLCILGASCSACGASANHANEDDRANSFKGEENAVALAEQMFTAIGGQESWRNLRSLYIKAEHTEPQLDKPYTSQIWRAIDHFQVRIEQNNEDFHAVGEVGETSRKITYLDQRDTFRILTDEQLAEWRHEHDHNVYVVLNRLATTPDAYTAKIEENDRLTFYQDTLLLTAFRLDEQSRPHLFYTPDANGALHGSRFTRWATTGGLVHSAGGHPLDSNFIYETEIWQPSDRPFEEAFPFDFK